MGKEALLLLNMGGINSIDEVKLFLENMFSDKHILPLPVWLRKRIAKRIIDARLEEVIENYKRLGGKSPLTEITLRLVEKLEKRLDMPVYPAMRYVPPFASEAIAKCKEAGIERLVLFPMYPQYSTTTTLSSVEDVKAHCRILGYSPEMVTIEPYFDDFDFVSLTVQKIIEATKDIDRASYDLILSAHGLPLKIVQNGDPYEKQVNANVSAIKTMLSCEGVTFRDIRLAYQSKVGNAKWLEPNLSDLLRNPTHKKCVLYPLSFTIDNSETLFELDMEHREIAEKLNFEDYRVIGCLNDEDAFADFIARKVTKTL